MAKDKKTQYRKRNSGTITSDYKNKPLVTIVVPIYNVSEFLSACIKSLASQTYVNLEIILINDGSTDNSGSICDDYASKDNRIRVIHQTNKGVSSARNAGIDAASGEWIMFVDGDDLLPPTATENLVIIASQSNADCTTGSIQTFDKSTAAQSTSGISTVTARKVGSKEALEQLLYQESIVNGPFAKLYKLNLIKNIKFKLGITVAEDLYFNYQALKKVKHVAMTSSIVYFYRLRDGSAMHQPFSHRRMDGLDMTELILKDSEKESIAALPAINRLFMEATFILQSINGNKEFHQQSSRCLDIVKRYRLTVLADLNSPLRHRLLACLSLIHPNMVTLPDHIRERLPSRGISKENKL